MSETSDLEHGPYYSERSAIEAARPSERHDSIAPETWGSGSGIYYQPLIRGAQDTNASENDRYQRRYRWPGGLTEISTRELQGLEVNLDRQISELIRLQGRAVVVDYSGANSLSWVKVAEERERKYKDISEGRLCMIVTNYNYQPSDGDIARNMERENNRETSDGKSPLLAYYTMADIDFIGGNQDLVAYVSGDIDTLLRSSIMINGNLVPLRSNVDIIHTRGGIFFSAVPEKILAGCADLLSEKGVLLVDYLKEEDIFEYANLILHLFTFVSDMHEAEKVWYEAFQNGYAFLQRKGLQNIAIPQSHFDYCIFAKPGAPNVLAS